MGYAFHCVEHEGMDVSYFVGAVLVIMQVLHQVECMRCWLGYSHFRAQ